MYVKYLNGTVVELVKAKYTKTFVQNVDVSQVPLTDLSIVRRLGLKWQEWVINGVITFTNSILWKDIVQVSLDNASWRNCVTTTVDFPRILIDQTLYELRLNVSPILEGAAVRYPTTGYLFGLQGIAGISQAGNVNAYPTIHYLAPLFYAPLSNTLIDFTGQAVTFTRTASKVHGGVTYPINTPIFDSGLYLASDTAQDVATWTPPAAIVRTIAMQIKQTRYPSVWSIGGGGVNLLTPNQSDAEVNTTGMTASGGTLVRNTTTPIAGAADFTVSATSGVPGIQTNLVPTVASKWYCFQAIVRAGATGAGRMAHLAIKWYQSDGGTYISTSMGASIAPPTTNTLLTMFAQAPALGVYAMLIWELDSWGYGENIYCDSLMLETIPDVLMVWSSAHNSVYIYTGGNVLVWGDGTTTVNAVFPTAAYLVGTIVDVVVLDDTAHAVTIVAHSAGGSWTSAAGTLAALTWPELALGNLEGSIANLVEYGYVLTSAEYQALAYSSLSLLFNTLLVGNRYAGEVIKGSDKRLLNALGSDISALLGGTDIAVGASAVTIAQSQGLSARWYVELKRTDV